MTRTSIQAQGVAHAKLTVNRRGERLYFDLFLPEGAWAFTSIAAVADVMKTAPTYDATRPWQDSTAGHLALKWRKPGGVFLMQRVDLLERFDKDYRPLGIAHPGGAFWASNELSGPGTRITPLAIRIPWDCRNVRGAYLDEINKARGADVPYDVDIYLTYSPARP